MKLTREAIMKRAARINRQYDKAMSPLSAKLRALEWAAEPKCGCDYRDSCTRCDDWRREWERFDVYEAR